MTTPNETKKMPEKLEASAGHLFDTAHTDWPLATFGYEQVAAELARRWNAYQTMRAFVDLVASHDPKRKDCPITGLAELVLAAKLTQRLTDNNDTL